MLAAELQRQQQQQRQQQGLCWLWKYHLRRGFAASYAILLPQPTRSLLQGQAAPWPAHYAARWLQKKVNILAADPNRHASRRRHLSSAWPTAVASCDFNFLLIVYC